MLRFSTIVWMIFIAGAALGLYVVKYRVQGLHEQVMQTERSLREEKEAMHVLEAEWTYLNRPERLRHLTEKYLTLQPADPKQIAELDSLPMRGEEPRQVAQEQPHGLRLTRANAMISR
jgi:hypothetical protein